MNKIYCEAWLVSLFIFRPSFATEMGNLQCTDLLLLHLAHSSATQSDLSGQMVWDKNPTNKYRQIERTPHNSTSSLPAQIKLAKNPRELSFSSLIQIFPAPCRSLGFSSFWLVGMRLWERDPNHHLTIQRTFEQAANIQLAEGTATEEGVLQFFNPWGLFKKKKKNSCHSTWWMSL